jgi:hypothetical protein
MLDQSHRPVAIAFGGDGRIVLLLDHFVSDGNVRSGCCHELETWFVGRSGRSSLGGAVTPLSGTVSGSLTPDGHGIS